MKTILVLTDFSKNARHAANTGVHLAARLHADVLILNHYLVTYVPSYLLAGNPPNDDPIYFKQECDEKLKMENERIDGLLETLAVKPKVNYMNAQGPLHDSITQITRALNITMIIMGGRKKKNSYFLSGSTVNSVVKYATVPVLVIPERDMDGPLNNVVFATDLSAPDITAVTYLTRLAEKLKFQTYIKHISEPEPVLLPNLTEEEKEAVFIEAMCKLNADISYDDTPGESITGELFKYIKNVKADMLTMVYKKHSFIWQLFHQCPAKEMISHQRIPLLIIPEKLSDKIEV